jgi:hypothetical protein
MSMNRLIMRPLALDRIAEARILKPFLDSST